MWSKEEVKKVVNAMSGGHYPDVKAAMSATAEVLMARGGRLTPEHWAVLLEQYGMMTLIISGNRETSLREIHREHGALVARVALLEQQLHDEQARFRRLEEDLGAEVKFARQERDAARAEAERLTKERDEALATSERVCAVVGDERVLRKQAQRERDAALADNAALLEEAGAAGHEYKSLADMRAGVEGPTHDPARCKHCRVMSAPHPGSALLEELTSLRAQVTMLMKDTTDLMSSAALVRARNEWRASAVDAIRAQMEPVKGGWYCPAGHRISLREGDRCADCGQMMVPRLLAPPAPGKST